MKLPQVQAGRGVVAKLKLAAIRVASGDPPQDVLRVILYRPEFFGKPFAAVVQLLLRGPSEFTVGERELFTAYVSYVNDGTFCYHSHRSVAERALGKDVVDKALSDFRTAPVSPQVDAEELASAGVSPQGAETLVLICFAFSVINRIADSLGFEVPSASAFDRSASVLLKHGSRSPRRNFVGVTMVTTRLRCDVNFREPKNSPLAHLAVHSPIRPRRARATAPALRGG